MTNKYPWWKSKKCGSCKRKIGKKEETADLRLDTKDGILELEICSDCARFFDVSADVLKRRSKVGN